MKILRLSTFLDFGGLETRLANISYIKDNNEWVFVCMNREGKAASIIKQNEKQVINLKAKPTIYSISTFLKVYKAIKKIKPDVIHTSGAEANFHGVLAGKLIGSPMIIAEEIGISEKSKLGKLVYQIIYRLADYVVGNSKPVISALQKYEKVPLQKLKTISNPVIFSTKQEKQEIDFPKGKINLISVSRLEPVKNIKSVIEVVKKLIDKGHSIHYNIIGSGSTEKNLKEQVKSLGIEQSVTFWGYQEDPSPFMSRAEIFILNSHTEGFSNSLAEAMYNETISISTNTGAANDMISNGKNGFIIPVNDNDALEETILKIIHLFEAEKFAIKKSAKEKVTRSYSLKSHRSELLKLYQSS